MITFDKVYKKFGTTTAVDGVSFTIKKGEVVGLLGVNGAGKTTTMRLALGIVHATSGVIVADSHNPAYERVELNKKVGYLPENNPLWNEMRVGEYLAFIAGIKGYDSTVETARVCALADIADMINKKIENLSRGYRQRVGLAAALIGDPHILILDEPTSGLDPLEQDKMRRLIKSLQKKKTIIISTHILSEVEASCSRVIIINRGRLAYEGAVPSRRGGLEKLFKKHVN